MTFFCLICGKDCKTHEVSWLRKGLGKKDFDLFFSTNFNWIGGISGKRHFFFGDHKIKIPLWYIEKHKWELHSSIFPKQSLFDLYDKMKFDIPFCRKCSSEGQILIEKQLLLKNLLLIFKFHNHSYEPVLPLYFLALLAIKYRKNMKYIIFNTVCIFITFYHFKFVLNIFKCLKENNNGKTIFSKAILSKWLFQIIMSIEKMFGSEKSFPSIVRENRNLVAVIRLLIKQGAICKNSLCEFSTYEMLLRFIEKNDTKLREDIMLEMFNFSLQTGDGNV
jgi:hypothetical protein